MWTRKKPYKQLAKAVPETFILSITRGSVSCSSRGGCADSNEDNGFQLLPDQIRDFRTERYWDHFFAIRTQAFEWYGEYEDLLPLLSCYLDRFKELSEEPTGTAQYIRGSSPD